MAIGVNDINGDILKSLVHIDDETKLDFFKKAVVEIVNARLSETNKDVQSIIAVYILAHFLTVINRDSFVVREKIGDSEVEYQKETFNLNGLASTSFGRMAILLDSSKQLIEDKKITNAFFKVF